MHLGDVRKTGDTPLPEDAIMKGDVIEVKYQGKWLQGTVLSTHSVNGKVMVRVDGNEYNVNLVDVRKRDERTWTPGDASIKLEVGDEVEAKVLDKIVKGTVATAEEGIGVWVSVECFDEKHFFTP